MYITSSAGLMWNSLRYSRPRATNARVSSSCHSTCTRFPVRASSADTSSRLTFGIWKAGGIFNTALLLVEDGDAVDFDVDAGAVRRPADARASDLFAGHDLAE